MAEEIRRCCLGVTSLDACLPLMPLSMYSSLKRLVLWNGSWRPASKASMHTDRIAYRSMHTKASMHTDDRCIQIEFTVKLSLLLISAMWQSRDQYNK